MPARQEFILGAQRFFMRTLENAKGRPDSCRGRQTAMASAAGKTHEGYNTVSFLPNLSGTGNALIITGTGGTAVSAALDFLSDERAMVELGARVGIKKGAEFPPFEALLKIEKGVTLPRNTSIVTCRALLIASAYSLLAQNTTQNYGKH